MIQENFPRGQIFLDITGLLSIRYRTHSKDIIVKFPTGAFKPFLRKNAARDAGAGMVLGFQQPGWGGQVHERPMPAKH